MADSPQARAPRRAPETEISVDLSESDGSKAVTRTAKPADIAANVRDDRTDGAPNYSDAERTMFKRMTRFQKNISKQFDQKLADQEARHQQELTQLREQYQGVSVERQGDAEAATAHEKAMKALEERLAAANEKGDSVDAARITKEMIQADGAYHARLSGTKQRADTTGAGAGTGTQQQQQRPAKAGGPTPAGSRFILANEDWWEDPEFAAEKAAAGAIYLQLMNDEHMEANDDETFKEVGRRLKAKFPNLAVVGIKRRREADPGDDDDDDLGDDESRREPDQHRRRAPAAAMQDRGAPSQRRQSGNRRTLSNQEIDTMRKVGMNPDNDKDVVQFLREAVAMEASA
jgi:hypothetical protein